MIIRRDDRKRVHFASLQSAYGQQVLSKMANRLNGFDSVMLLDGEKVQIKSDAVLGVLKHLGGWYRLWTPLRFIPRWFRDMIYDWIARHRYAWFGQRETCMIPSPELKERFLD